MIRRRRGEAGDSLAFLDIITCGFGAMILLLLITKPVPDDIDFSVQQPDLSASIEQASQNVAALQFELQGLQSELSATPEPANQSVDEQLTSSIQAARKTLEELKSSNLALARVRTTMLEANITQTTAPQLRDPEVGGIPVDGEYVIFIIDTSGSMLSIWDKVVEMINRIIDVHPKVRGFQIMNDNGNYLMETTRGKWLPDTPKSRQNVKNSLNLWNSFSNSSPVEGLVAALRTYGKTREKISIYVVGDEFTGPSYDTVIDTLEELNVDKSTGQPKVRVHGIGLLSEIEFTRFSTLMRNVVERNRGAFLGLPY